MKLRLADFYKAVAFYAYPAIVTSPFIEVINRGPLNSEDIKVINFIDDVRKQLNDLHIGKKNNGTIPTFRDDTLLCTTGLDNKTVVALSNAEGITLYFGKYDNTYRIGFGVNCLTGDERYKIDLIDKNIVLL